MVSKNNRVVPIFSFIIVRFEKKFLKRNNINLRYSSNVYTPPAPVAMTGTAVAKDESRDFMAVFPDIVRDLTDAGRHLDIPDVTKWYAKVITFCNLSRI